eukprot:CAMPEP_0202373586 /NCGR_PEP_ID=MMETSP1127-20130417/4595_1 /ASSEMBLY_ACC=CAM_ASM_000462 /TAXON_ID=3047 /ORGANISM="Dunaliella tertiolecta, Strain CCMP1320" /LENGTH=918 /DNA_ID=CAMNT_0048970523 /DNA_START=167 /DNA_END=2923 /DNA_ORIENTATION=-
MPSLSSAEGSIWWSLNPKGPLPHGNMVAIAPITERELSSWLDDTVGWHAIEITAEAFQAAGAHHTQIRPYVQAAFEAVARINTHKCMIRAVDLDFQLGACLRMALAAYFNLRTLVLAELNVYDEAVLQLASGLSSSESLSKLVLDQVDLGSSGWAAVMGALKESSSIKALILRQCCNWSAVSGLAAALPQIQALQVLDLKGNVVRDPSLKTLCEALSKNSSVTSLSLSECGLGVPECHAVADLLRHSPVLERLDVSHNALGHEGCSHVALALTASTSLQHLSLSHAGCDDSVVTGIMGALSVCHPFTSIPYSNLTSLDLGYGRVTASGSLALAREARRGNLREVCLSGNCCMETEGVKVWAEETLRTASCRLTRLALCDCEATDEAAEAIAHALRPEGSLAALELASNQFTQSGISALISAARSCPGMRLLDVSFNWIGPRAMQTCLTGEEGPETLPGSSSQQEDGLQVKHELLLEFRSIEAVKCGAGLVPPGESRHLGDVGVEKHSRQRSRSESSSSSTDDQETDTDSTATQASSSCLKSRAAASSSQAFPQASVERLSPSPTSQTYPTDQPPSPASNPFLQPQAFSLEAGRPSDGYGDGGARWADLAECDGLLDGTINVPLPVSVSIPPLPPSPKPLQRDEPQGTDGGATDAEAGSLPSLGPELPNMPMGEDAGNPFLDPALTQQSPQQQQQQQQQQQEQVTNPFLEPEFPHKDQGGLQQQHHQDLLEASNPFLGPGGKQQEQQQASNPFLGPGGKQQEQQPASNPFLEPGGKQQEQQPASNPCLDPGGEQQEQQQASYPCNEPGEEQQEQQPASNPFLEPGAALSKPGEQQEEQLQHQEASNPFLKPETAHIEPDKQQQQQRQQQQEQELAGKPFLEPMSCQGKALSKILLPGMQEEGLQVEHQHQHHYNHYSPL